MGENLIRNSGKDEMPTGEDNGCVTLTCVDMRKSIMRISKLWRDGLEILTIFCH